MFESSVVPVSREGQEGRRAALLTVSVTVHTLVVIAILAASLRTLDFPNHAPNERAIFVEPLAPVMATPAKGIPDAPKKQVAAPAGATPHDVPVSATVPQVSTTPSVIPSSIPIVASSSEGPSSDGPAGIGTGSDGPGLPSGDPSGTGTEVVQGSEPGGILEAGGEVHAARVLTRVEPLYPRAAIASRMSGLVRLKCVIDRQGNVVQSEVISSTFGAFTKPALDALQRWTFAPGSLHGHPVDTYFELTITFHAQ